MPFKYGVYETEFGKPCFNGCVFETRTEANRAGVELLSRWTLPHHFEVFPTEEPINYCFPDDAYRPISLAAYAATSKGV